MAIDFPKNSEERFAVLESGQHHFFRSREYAEDHIRHHELHGLKAVPESKIVQACKEYEALIVLEDAAKAIFACWTQGIPHYDGMAGNAVKAYEEAKQNLAALRNSLKKS